MLSTVSFLDFNDGTAFIILSLIMPIISREFSDISDGVLKLMESAYFIGMIIGSFLSGHFSDKYGRKAVIQFSSFGYAFVCLYSLFITNAYEVIVQ